MNMNTSTRAFVCAWATLVAACSGESTESQGGSGGAGGSGGSGGAADADPLGLIACAEPAPASAPVDAPALDGTDEAELAALCSLRSLDPYFERARVICLGEGSHGVAEATDWHALTIRYLAHRWDVRTVAFEMDGASVDRWDHYLDVGDDAWLDSGFTAPGTLADSEDTEGFVRALRELDLELGGALELAGYDVAVVAQPSIENLVGFWKLVDEAEATALEAELTSGAYATRAAAAEDAVATLIAEEQPFVAATDPALYANALRDARNLADGLQFLSLYFDGEFWEGNKLHREPGIIRNVESLLAKSPEQRLVLVSHNGHCGRRASASGVLDEADEFPSMGTHLALTLGDGYVVHAQAYGGGEQLMLDGSTNTIAPNSGYVESTLAGLSDAPTFLLETSSPSVDLSSEYEMWNVDALIPAEQFDTLLFLRTVSPTTPR
jgi:erythromycin esterase-like protein